MSNYIKRSRSKKRDHRRIKHDVKYRVFANSKIAKISPKEKRPHHPGTNKKNTEAIQMKGSNRKNNW